MVSRVNFCKNLKARWRLGYAARILRVVVVPAFGLRILLQTNTLGSFQNILYVIPSGAQPYSLYNPKVSLGSQQPTISVQALTPHSSPEKPDSLNPA